MNKTRAIVLDYERRLASSRARNGSARPELSAVRVREQTCPASETTTGQTNTATDTTAQVSGTTTVTEDEYERINKARFEENLAQLEALREWVLTLYRTYGAQ